MNEPTDTTNPENLVELDTSLPVWDRFFTVAPLVLVGTLEDDGGLDLAPKHMVTPMGWQNYFGFVCSPAHATCRNIDRSGEFTVSYPKPSQLLYTSLAASPREVDGSKNVLQAFETIPARTVSGHMIRDAYLFLECRHHKTVDGFGDNCLITGEIVAARVAPEFLRSSELDDQDLIRRAPLFAYLSPGRFAAIDASQGFPFPVDMKR